MKHIVFGIIFSLLAIAFASSLWHEEKLVYKIYEVLALLICFSLAIYAFGDF